MKWLTIILSLYLLGLSLWPCADELLPYAGREESAVVMLADVPQPGSEHQDLCTPFCTCTCCATTLTNLLRFGYSLLPPTDCVAISTDHFTYVPMRWAAPYAAIWQPPQIRV